ncbi:hypothetical protein ABZ372_37295, partial [Streptomyces sp. NPDC005921]
DLRLGDDTGDAAQLLHRAELGVVDLLDSTDSSEPHVGVMTIWMPSEQVVPEGRTPGRINE